MPRATYTIATDLSSHSLAAARVAARLAERTHAGLDFFCALPAAVPGRYRVHPAHVRELLEALAARHSGAASPATAHVAVVRDVPRAIVRHAKHSGASLLVVAPRGVTGWRKILLGSVAEKVLREATTSVLVARAASAAAPGPVLAGVDLGPSTAVVLRHAVAVARALGADLDVVHVVAPVEFLMPAAGPLPAVPGRAGSRLAEPARDLARRVETLAHRGVRIATRAVEGGPAETLVREARRTRARLVVVSATTKSRARRAVLGSVAHAVAAVSPVSVLVVR